MSFSVIFKYNLNIDDVSENITLNNKISYLRH